MPERPNAWMLERQLWQRLRLAREIREQGRREEEERLAVVLGVQLRAEQPADDRDLREQRDLDDGVRVVLVREGADYDRRATWHPPEDRQLCADLVRKRGAIRPDGVPRRPRDAERDEHRDRAVPIHARRGAQL